MTPCEQVKEDKPRAISVFSDGPVPVRQNRGTYWDTGGYWINGAYVIGALINKNTFERSAYYKGDAH